jgi:hypothetical protein
MKMRTLVGLPLAAVLALPVFADEPANGGVHLVQPSPKPPVSRPGPLTGQLASGARAAAPPSGELAGMRAVSMSEGSGVISLAGATRSVRRGDAIGTATVKAVGSDRLVLERPAGPSATAALIVITFGPSGEARVRTYTPVTDPLPSPEPR